MCSLNLEALLQLSYLPFILGWGYRRVLDTRVCTPSSAVFLRCPLPCHHAPFLTEEVRLSLASISGGGAWPIMVGDRHNKSWRKLSSFWWFWIMKPMTLCARKAHT